MTGSNRPQWTPSQKAAVEHIDGALLVSAAAGSGKTAVLAARCAYLVCDAPEPCDVDELLVLTFTRAAAAEMRERIDSAIRERAEQPDANERILRQLRLIDRASITTIDAFCAQMVREHFHLVGVDPGFALLAPEDASLLRNDVAHDLILAEFDAPDSPIFRALLDGYFGGDVTRLRQAIVRAHSLSQTIVDPAGWAKAALERLREAAAGKGELLEAFLALQGRSLSAAIAQLVAITLRAESYDGLGSYAAHARTLASTFEEWHRLSAAGDLDTLASLVSDYEPPRLPTIKGDLPGKEFIKGAIDAVKKRTKKSGDFQKLLRWSRRELRTESATIVPVAERYFSLFGRFTIAYDIAKRAIRSLDFSDVEANALRILRAGENPSATAIALQLRFRHVLVDEFQDINPLQYALLRFVSRDRSAEINDAVQSNLFSVGDVKQSIYRFRLAEPQQFIDRRSALADAKSSFGKAIDLQENFRSRAPLLEAINDVFCRLMTGESTGIAYDETHELKWQQDYSKTEKPHYTGKPIELHILPTESPSFDDTDTEANDEADELTAFEREVQFIADRIHDIVERERPNVTVKRGGQTIVRHARYGDVVVLLRSARFKSSQVADTLRTRGMPVHSDDATGFFAATEVQDILSVLRLLSNARQDVSTAAVLRSPFFALQQAEDSLASIRCAFPEEPFHRAVVRYANEVADSLGTSIRTILDQLTIWRTHFRERPIGEALRGLIEFNGFDTFCRARDDGEQRHANLQELMSRADAFDAFERQGLDRFLLFLEELEENDELGRPSLGAESDDVVRVMTIHKSKGLEFPIVIIPDLGKRFNTTSLNDPILLDRDWGIGMTSVDLSRRIRYPSLSSLVVRDHVARQSVAEEVRVLYVALTRAREHLVLVGSAKPGSVERWREGCADCDVPLSDEAIHGASSVLDWLVPIAAMTEHSSLGTFDLTDHAAAPFQRDLGAVVGPITPETTEPSLARLIEPTDAVAKLAIDRIRFEYPHRVFTTQRATMPLTQFVAKTLPEIRSPRDDSMTLDWPAAYRPRERASAADVGSATHLLLAFLDFTNAHSADAIRLQCESLVLRKLISPRDASLVDVDSIAWLIGTDIGEMLRRFDVRVLREQPLAIALPPRLLPTGVVPELGDRVLIRGRVDVIVEAQEGLTLLDYKSDRLMAHEAGERAARYSPQLLGYSEALAAVSSLIVRRAAFVFLHARRVVDVPLL